MKINIVLQSALLCASGESTAHIDAFPKFDKYGIPYIPGKTFKGVLKESTREVCEMFKYDANETEQLIISLYGHRNGTGKLQFDNVRIVNYTAVKEEVAELLNNEAGKVSTAQIIKYYTGKRRQTKINSEGTAEVKSLRTYLVIKKNISHFELAINESQLTEPELEMLQKSLINLRYIGLKRNRGFGKIKIEIKPGDALQNEINIEALPHTNSEKTLAGEPGEKQFLKFRIKALNPLQIAKLVGDQNTVGTEHYIPAMTIRGLIANLMIRKEGLGEEAHRSELFKAIVFNNIFYQNALPVFNNKKSQPAIMAIGFDKMKSGNEKQPLCVFDECNDDKTLRPYKGWNTCTGYQNNSRVPLVNYFHHQREQNRVSGKSEKDSGAIFYYEAIEEDQVFEACIYGGKNHLNYISHLLALHNGVHFIGASKSSQYAKTLFFDCRLAVLETAFVPEINKVYHLVCQSHLILKNEYGLTLPDIDNLNEVLKKYGFWVMEAAASFEVIENFVGIREAKTNMDNAFAIGSTFRVKCTAVKDISPMICEGIGERLQEGFGKILFYGEDLNEQPLTVLKEMDAAETVLDTNHKIETKPGNSLADKKSDLLAFIESEKLQAKLREMAFEQAANAPAITNSMVNTLKDILRRSNSIPKWKEEALRFAENKKGRALTAKNFFNKFIELQLPINVTYKKSLYHEFQRPYWQKIFNYMLKKNRNQS